MHTIDSIARSMSIIENLPRTRLAIVICIFLAGIGVIFYENRMSLEKPTSPVSFDSFPRKIGDWDYSFSNTFNSEIDKMLGADTYIDYIYHSPGKGEMEVLASYFSSMHEGKQFHSPKNCMLGSGWEPQENKEILIRWHGKEMPVNFMVVRKDTQIVYVVYWVQGRGRIMASEYQERIYRVLDAVLKRRTDGAFVRISLSDGLEDRLEVERMMAPIAHNVALILENYLPQ